VLHDGIDRRRSISGLALGVVGAAWWQSCRFLNPRSFCELAYVECLVAEAPGLGMISDLSVFHRS